MLTLVHVSFEIVVFYAAAGTATVDLFHGEISVGREVFVFCARTDFKELSHPIPWSCLSTICGELARGLACLASSPQSVSEIMNG